MDETAGKNDGQEKDKGGRRSLLSVYLDKNRALKEIFLKASALPDSAEQDFTDIKNIDDLIEYAGFELTRSKNENLLRGKTFCEYEKAFTHLFEMKAKLEVLQKDAEVRQLVERRNRDEVTAFMKIVFEAITDSVEDLPLRKKISDKIQELYDRYYPEPKPVEPDAKSGGGSQIAGEAAGPVVS